VAAPVFVNSTSAENVGTNVALTAPAGLAAGDFQVAVIVIGTESESVPSPPSGWAAATSLQSAGGGDSFGAFVFTSTTDTGTATFVKSGTREGGGVRLAWSGHNGMDGTAASAETSGTSHAVPAATVTTADSLVIGGVVMDGGSAFTFTPPGGWTERFDGSVTASSPFELVTVAEVASAPGTVNGSFTSSGSDAAVTWSLVLAPAAGGGGDVPIVWNVVVGG
jgi:hypothetical protein